LSSHKQSEKRRRRLLKAAYITAVLAGATVCSVSQAQTTREWFGNSDGNYNGDTNWSDDTVPGATDQARFGNVATSVDNITVTAGATIDRIHFAGGANAQEFTLNIANNVTLNVQGTNDFDGGVVAPQGVVNSSGLTQTFNVGAVNSSINFYGATADSRSTLTNIGDGSAIAINNTFGSGSVNFYGFSSAGDSGVTITNENGGSTRFNELSDAGSANLINNATGTIYFDALSSAGSATITNNSGGQVTFDGNSTADEAFITNNSGGQVLFTGTSRAGTSSIANESGGQLIFTGNSSAEGATITNAGVLDFLAVAQGGTANVINNVGGVVNVNTAADGTDLTLGYLRGAGNVVLTDNLTLNAPDAENNATISGIISGGGNLTKEGGNIVRLEGANTYTGTTTINNGVLSLTGSLTSNTTINAAGELRGNGSITGNLTNNGGRLVTGDADGDSTYSVLYVTGTFDSTNADSTTVSRVTTDHGMPISNWLYAEGVAQLGGDVEVEVDQTPGTIYYVNNWFGIVYSDTERQGTFTGVDLANSDIPDYLELTEDAANGINGGLSYDTNAAYVHLRRNTLDDLIDGVNLTRNQRAVYNALNVDDFGDLNADQEWIIDEFIHSTAHVGSAEAASLLSGDALTAFPVAAQGAASRFNQRLLSQAANKVVAEESYAQARSPRMVYSGNTYRTLMAQNNDRFWPTVGEETAPSSGVWATIARAKEDTDSDGNGPGFDTRATEYQVGYNRNLGNGTTVGISIGKSDADININDRSAKGDLDTTSIGAYFRHDVDDLYFSGLLSYSRHKIDSRRSPNPFDTVSADYDARTIGVWGEVGKKVGRGSLGIEPHISLKLSNTKQDAFSESGFGGLDVDAEKYNTRRLGLGVRVVTNSATARFRPYGFVGYEREFGDQQAELNSSVAGLSSFNVKGSQLGKNIWALRLGTDARISDRFSVVGEIGASWRKNQDSRYVYGGVKYGW